MQLDLNLLTALDALLEEGSVGGAARRLHLSEPAASRALGRLRVVVGDPLLVRSGRSMVLTPRAVDLRSEVHALVSRAQAVLAPAAEPDLSVLNRTFSLLSEDVGVVLGPELLARVRASAPGVVLRFLGESPAAVSTALRDGVADLDVGVAPAAAPPEILSEPLFTDHMAAVVRAGNPLATGRMTRERFAAAGHVSASRRGQLTGPVDEDLAAHGLSREVSMSVPTFGAALFVVARTDLVGLMPRRLGRRTVESLGLVAIDPPMDLPPIAIAQSWHQRYDADGAHRWLREQVRNLLTSVD